LGGEGAATEPALGCFTDGRREKMINKYAAIVYMRLNASMIKQKKKKIECAYSNDTIVEICCPPQGVTSSQCIRPFLIMTRVCMFRPVGEHQRFANFLPGSRTGERFVNRLIFANHARIDVSFLQYVLPVCNIYSNPLTNWAGTQTGLSGSETGTCSQPHSAGLHIG